MTAMEDLTATRQARFEREILAAAPKSYRPGEVKENPDGTSTVTSHPTPEPNPRHDQLLRDHGYDPERDMIVGPINTRSWNVYKPESYRETVIQEEGESDNEYETRKRDSWTDTFYYHRFNTTTRPGEETATDVAELVEAIANWRPPVKPLTPTSNDGAFIFAIGDTQIFKYENPLSELVQMFQQHTEEAIADYQGLKNRPPHVHLPWLGDCIEGFVSQGGKNAWRTTGTLTEQVRVVRRLMLHQVKTFAPHCDRLTIVSVPGNHDEAAQRTLATRSDDSWAVEALVGVEESLQLAEGFDHVECYVPGPDQHGVTLEVGGALIAHVHGHQFRPGKEYDWWKGQHFGGQDEGQATILLHGHQHHYQVEEDGHRVRICTPAMEKESVWWKHKTGTPGNPGSLTIHIEDGRPTTVRRLY